MSENIHIFLATPMYGGMCHGEYCHSCVNLFQEVNKQQWSITMSAVYNDSLVTSARNDLVNQFLDTNCSHLLFIDSDIGFNAKDIPRMIREQKDIVCGCYPIKSLDWDRIRFAIENNASNEQLKYSCRYVYDVVDNESPNLDIGSNKLKELSHGGTGFMLINRKVFELLGNHVSWYIGDKKDNYGKKIYNFFQTPVSKENKVLLPEDYFFCEQFRKIGGKIYLAQYALATHSGSYSFGAKL